MLTVTKLTDAEYLLGQVALGIDDYYMGIGEAPGVWQGRLAAQLGLSGLVDADALRALLLGRHPGTDVDLLAGRRQRPVAALDLTFSAPKSVSLLWAFASPEVSSVASIAHVEAVAVALGFLERKAGATRQQTDGKRQRVPTGLAVATFVHRTSREGDPQLHTHCVVANLGQRPDGSFAALDAAPFYEWAKAAGSIYQEELRRRLTKRLGVEWGPDRNGCREMEGFESEWLRTFSKRTAAIEGHLAGAGPEEPDPVTRMRADDAASLATRPAKDPSLTPEVLRERWQEEADGIHLPTGHALEAQVTGWALGREPLDWDELVDALIDPEVGLCSHRARFNEAHVVEAIAALGGGRLDVERIEQLAAHFLESAEVVRLVDRTGRRSSEYSTVDHLALEERVLEHLDDLTAAQVAGIDACLVEAATAEEQPGLGADQVAAVQGLCGSGSALRVLIAPAGFGKTTAVHAAAVAAGRGGRPVLGLAATNQAAGELRQAAIPALTIARFALEAEALASGTVVILDEVSQVATADAEIVLAALAATPDAQLWCLGDPHQAQSVRAGGLGAELARLAASGLIPVPVLTENRRQREEAERQALIHYRDGEVAASQAIRSEHGWEHDLGSPHATREALAGAVVADITLQGPAEVVALAVSHADCEDLADRIRARLRGQGHLTGPELAGPGWGHGERHYAAGDRLLVHGTLWAQGRRLHNGSVLTVTGVDEAGLRCLDDRCHTVVLPKAFVEGRRSDGSPNVSHAWARTVDGIQGGTWTQVHLLGTAALERYTGYVGQSRSREATHTWNVSRLPEVDFGGILADQRTPDEAVLDALRRVPDTGFATHDDPRRVQRLKDERRELKALIATRPPDRRQELRQAEEELYEAQGRRYRAEKRLRAIEEDLAELGPLKVLLPHHRREKAELTERREGLTHDVARAGEDVARCERQVEGLQDEVDATRSFDQEHAGDRVRLAAVERVLGFVPDGPGTVMSHVNELVHGVRWERGSGRARTRSEWLNRLADIARPLLPGRDLGHGIDFGP